MRKISDREKLNKAVVEADCVCVCRWYKRFILHIFDVIGRITT